MQRRSCDNYCLASFVTCTVLLFAVHFLTNKRDGNDFFVGNLPTFSTSPCSAQIYGEALASKLHYKLYFECKDGSRKTNTMGFEKEITKATDLIAVHQKMFGYKFLKSDWDCNKDLISPSEVVVCKEK